MRRVTDTCNVKDNTRFERTHSAKKLKSTRNGEHRSLKPFDWAIDFSLPALAPTMKIKKRARNPTGWWNCPIRDVGAAVK